MTATSRSSATPAPSDASVDEVARLLDEARAAINRYQLDDGGRLLERARELLAAGAPAPADLALRIGITGSWLTFERAGIVAAAAELEALAAQCRSAGEWGLVGICELQHGILLTRTGELPAALTHMRAAGAHQSAMRPEDQVRLSLSRGTLLYQLGEWGPAADDFRAAATAAAAAGLPTQQFKALHNQGCAAFVQGDLPLALRLMDEADLHRGPVNPALTLIDRARVLAEAGLVSDATAALLESVSAFAAAGLHREVAEIDVDLARCEILLGRPEVAAGRAAQAAEAFAARGEPYWASRARLVELQAESLTARQGPARPPTSDGMSGVAAAASNPTAVAVPVLTAPESTAPEPDAHLDATRHVRDAAGRAAAAADLAAAAMARGEHSIAALAAVEVAEALCDGMSPGDAGPLAQATAVLDEARALSRSPYLAARLAYAHARVRTDLAAGRLRPARARLARAAEDLAGAQRRTAGLDARTALAVHARRLAELDLDLALERADPIVVLHCLERWRRAVAPVTPVRPPADPQEAQLLGRLRQARETLAQASPEELGRARAELRRLERAASAARWRTHGPELPTAGQEPSYDELRAAVDAAAGRSTGLVGLATLKGRAFAVVLPADGAGQVVDLGLAATLRRLIDRACADSTAAAHAADNPHLGGLVAAAAERSARALDEALSAALNHVRSQRLVVLDGAALGTIPFGLLPSRRGLPATVTPSLSRWAAAPSRAHPPGHPASADPLVAALAGPGVPYGTAEVARVRAAWADCAMPGAGGSVGGFAEREDLLHALTVADVVHVAAHGSHQSESPLFSCLSLGDGPVFAHELESRPLETQLVILSACEAGRATARPGEEALGWPAALLALGARSVVAPLAAVRDDDTGALMAALHEGLIGGLDVAEALAVAAAPLPSGSPFTCFGATWAR